MHECATHLMPDVPGLSSAGVDKPRGLGAGQR